MTLDNKNSFDPFTATKDDMYADIQAFWQCETARSRIRQWEQAQEIQQLRSEVEAGNGAALMECVSIIFRARLTPPEWLAKCFDNTYCAVVSGEHLSWDDAFGKPHPKMTSRQRLDNERQKVARAYKIGRHIHGEVLRNTDKTMTRLYADAANIYGGSIELAKEFYHWYLDDLQYCSESVKDRHERLGTPPAPNNT